MDRLGKMEAEVGVNCGNLGGSGGKDLISIRHKFLE